MTNQVNNQSLISWTDVIQLTLTLKMTTAHYRTVAETSVTVNNNSPTQDYVHPGRPYSTYLWNFVVYSTDFHWSNSAFIHFVHH